MEAITFEAIKTACLVLVALWGFNKVISEIVNKIGQYKLKKDQIDNLDVTKLKSDHEKYDTELSQIRSEIGDIKEELYFQTECNAAIMDGLVQLNCNGPVKETKERLDNYLNKRAHNVC